MPCHHVCSTCLCISVWLDLDYLKNVRSMIPITSQRRSDLYTINAVVEPSSSSALWTSQHQSQTASVVVVAGHVLRIYQLYTQPCRARDHRPIMGLSSGWGPGGGQGAKPPWCWLGFVFKTLIFHCIICYSFACITRVASVVLRQVHRLCFHPNRRSHWI